MGIAVPGRRGVGVGLIAVVAALVPAVSCALPKPVNVTVDFAAAVHPVPPDAFGADITGYGGGHYITNDGAERAMLGGGRYGQLRMELRYATPGNPNSPIVAGGAGAEQSVTGDQWVTAMKDLGAAPLVIVPLDAVDAANLVRHFNTGPTPNRVGRWVVGNEPDGQGISADSYAASFNTISDAMKAVDPTIEVGGPANAWPNMTFIQRFLQLSGSRTDFIDFHKYGMGGPSYLCDADLLAQTGQWENDVNQVRSTIASVVPSRASAIDVQVGELNSDWSAHTDTSSCPGNIGTEPVQYRNAAIWWAASVFGHIVRAGGLGLAYGDKNGALGLLYDQDNASRPPYARNGAGLDERMPLYQGVGFFTGQEGTSLSHFGTTLVSSSTTLDGVEVYASTNPKVIVLINTGGPKDAVIGLPSGSTVTGHQKDGSTVSYVKPAALGPLTPSAGQIQVHLPGPSVTQLVVT
jgi:hypothetical protein